MKETEAKDNEWNSSHIFIFDISCKFSSGSYLQIALPREFTIQVVLGPQGDGLHGSGFGAHFNWLQINP